MILDDRKNKLIQIAGTLKVSRERVSHIFHALSRKLCAKRILRDLTIKRLDAILWAVALTNENDGLLIRMRLRC